ncbi:MarR family transcriptional regulator [Bacillus sp. FJAT-42376]|uniref:MarR family winged helix-turn-helix transcriptional regulator n=1 Tax=Bacillus sp. FJAT-42376 TaxID=2014076 RepID=UPI000F501629|nr:MarR family transcriptional regulator [Bacillus sp. FJAT-42376]AZB42069.1 MarR family transcriptional regulator [Bacillus sp. FJAT-42376]
MENTRELFQVMVRRFGLLDKNCCSVGSLELSLVQSHILYEVERREAPSIQEIADTLGTDITTFSRQVQGLVKIGLIEKKQSVEDKRIYQLFLTSEGKDIASSIDTQMNGYLKEVFSYMQPEERNQVIESVKLLNQAMAKSAMCCRPVK